MLLAGCPGQETPPFAEMVDRSGFIFEGTVVEAGAATLPQVPPSEHNVIVELGEIFRGEALLAGVRDDRVTVRLRDPGSPAIGETVVFLAQGWIYADGIALEEVGHLAGEIDPAVVRDRIDGARQELADRRLRERIAQAELVIAGRVVETRDALIEEPISEHAPMWTEAHLSVDEVIKGEGSMADLVVVFPSSPDILWVDAPRYEVGEEGCWLLHRHPELEVLTSPREIDFQPRESLDRLRTLARSTQR